MCAISCRITLARPSYWTAVAREVNTKSSVKVTRPGFSMAPRLYSGTNAWSYLPHGYATPKRSWKNVSPRLVTSNTATGSNASAIVRRVNSRSGTACAPLAG